MLWVWAACTGVLLIRLFVAGLHAGAVAGPPPTAPVCIDLNRASVPELMALPGIGRWRARAIVLHRVRHGAFTGLDDLLRIDGIGPQTLAGLKPYLVPLSGERPQPGARDHRLP